MEYSSAEMTCVLKVNSQCEECKVKVMQILQNIRGVYNITIDGEQGTVKVTGKVNPSTLLGVLEKYGRHAEVKYVKFDGEVVESPRYYGEYGYAPCGMECSYPLLGCPQHQWHQTSLSFCPPPPTPVPPPPSSSPSPPPPPPSQAPFQVIPPPPPPLAPFWAPPPRPSGSPPLAPFWTPPPPGHVPRGGASRQNKKVVTERNHCTIM